MRQQQMQPQAMAATSNAVLGLTDDQALQQHQHQLQMQEFTQMQMRPLPMNMMPHGICKVTVARDGTPIAVYTNGYVGPEHPFFPHIYQQGAEGIMQPMMTPGSSQPMPIVSSCTGGETGPQVVSSLSNSLCSYCTRQDPVDDYRFAATSRDSDRILSTSTAGNTSSGEGDYGSIGFTVNSHHILKFLRLDT